MAKKKRAKISGFLDDDKDNVDWIIQHRKNKKKKRKKKG